MRWIGFRLRTPSFFEPGDRLVDARLQQMHKADPSISPPNEITAGVKPNGLLGKGDRFLIRAAAQKLAYTQLGKGAGIIAVGAEHDLKLGNRLTASALVAQQ